MLYITHPLNGILMLAIPIGLGIYLTCRFRLSWRLWWIGAITFVLSQVGHIPFNFGIDYLFKHGILPLPPVSWRLPVNSIILGLSAGIWEESFRYIAYRWWAKEARSWRKALLLGAGHGGIEAILLGSLVILSYFQMLALQGVDPAKVASAEQAQILEAVTSQYWSIPWYASLLGAVERIFAIVTHLALSVLVWQVFRRLQSRWLWLAIGWHALLNAGAVYAAHTWGAFQAEGILACAALIDLAIISALRPSDAEIAPLEITPPSPQPVRPVIKEIEETPENIEQTRYN